MIDNNLAPLVSKKYEVQIEMNDGQPTTRRPSHRSVLDRNLQNQEFFPEFPTI